MQVAPEPKPAAPAVKINVPEPVIAKLVPAPESVESIVLVPLSVMVGLAARLIVPPERIRLPEADPNVMLPELTVPETVMVPATRPAVAVPKLSVSPVPVVTLPGTAVPAELVLQPGVGPGVGAAHVPPAVPKPVVLELLS